MLTRFLRTAAAGIVAFGLCTSVANASEHETCGVDIENATPSGTVTGSVKTIGFLVSARWGNGVLTLANGEQRTFHVIGAKALETGVAKNDFVGEVYNLTNVDDFEGTYYGASTNITLGSLGKGEAVANNARCVVVKFRMKGTGLNVSGPAPGGVEVSFND
jgi:lipid-binding SYLF domain-containing protein